MIHIILYSVSQKNEFYKVYNKKKKKITIPQNCFDIIDSVSLQKYLHKFQEHSSPAQNI